MLEFFDYPLMNVSRSAGNPSSSQDKENSHKDKLYIPKGRIAFRKSPLKVLRQKIKRPNFGIFQPKIAIDSNSTFTKANLWKEWGCDLILLHREMFERENRAKKALALDILSYLRIEENRMRSDFRRKQKPDFGKHRKSKSLRCIDCGIREEKTSHRRVSSLIGLKAEQSFFRKFDYPAIEAVERISLTGFSRFELLTPESFLSLEIEYVQAYLQLNEMIGLSYNGDADEATVIPDNWSVKQFTGSNKKYYYNSETGAISLDIPDPEGWVLVSHPQSSARREVFPFPI